MLDGIRPSLFPICPPSQQAYLSDIVLSALQNRLRAEADEALRDELEAEARGEVDLPMEPTAISAEVWEAHILE
jgi:hypothetical protein